MEVSWPELLELLIEGDLDLLSDVSHTEERAERILYSDEVMGSLGYHAFISPDNAEIRPATPSTLDGKRVLVNEEQHPGAALHRPAGKDDVAP